MPQGPEFLPKTLVINQEDTLLHKTIEFGKGIELKKRPGLTQFQNHLRQYYEIVVFSDSPTMMAEEYVTALDPQRQTQKHVIGHEFYKQHNGFYVKDLSYMNRPKQRMVCIDFDESILPNDKENTIILKPFTGDGDDNEQMKAQPLLIKLASPKVRDVRQEQKKLGENPITAYNEIIDEQIRIAEAKIGKQSSKFSTQSTPINRYR